MSTSLAPLIAECDRTLEEAIEHFDLTVRKKNIVVTVQTRGRKNAIGWFWAGRWKNSTPRVIHEINLSAEFLSQCDMGETLLHELAHAENNALGIKDCSGRRHNRKFKSMAERLGLEVLPIDKAVGYGFTKLAAGGREFLEKCAFKRELFDSHRMQPVSSAKAGSRMVKMECPTCGYVARAAQKWLDVGLPTCPCHTKMEVAA